MSFCTFFITCPSECAVSFCDARAMTRSGSYGTAIRICQQPKFLYSTVDCCKWLVFKRCGQVKLGSCRRGLLLFGVRARCVVFPNFLFRCLLLYPAAITDGF